MNTFLTNKNILIGITGSIAAYKSADLVRRLREAGANVRVAMTESAKRFITPLTMQAVSGSPVHDDLFDLQAEAAMGHIELARWADAVLIAPASADFIARLAHGMANDLLTTVCLATRAPIAIAPAMNQVMWQHPLTQENIKKCRTHQFLLFDPALGQQACGDVGQGRMQEPTELLHQLNQLFAPRQLAGVKVVITAGPTHEAIDPVRYIANGSSGKMGYSLAQAAMEVGADVTLISGPVSLTAPHKVNVVPVITAKDMENAVSQHINDCQIFISVAAVCDYRPQHSATQKIHKCEEMLTLTFERNPDIISNIGKLVHKPYIVGFAAETHNVIEQAQAKRIRKQMDMIVANQVGQGLGMGCDDNSVMVITERMQIPLDKAPKMMIARQLINIIAKEYVS